MVWGRNLSEVDMRLNIVVSSQSVVSGSHTQGGQHRDISNCKPYMPSVSVASRRPAAKADYLIVYLGRRSTHARNC